MCRAVEDIHDVRYDGDAISFDAQERSVEELSLSLARAGIAIRSVMAPTSPLETLFFQLTGGAKDSELSEQSDSMTVASIR